MPVATPIDAHQRQLAADPQAQPRLDLVPGIARAGAPVGRHERQQVALELGVLDQPEEHDRQERGEGHRRFGRRRADLDHLVRIRRRLAGHARDRVDERGHRRRQDVRVAASSAHERADSKKAGSPATTCSPWAIAAGTTMNARPSTVTKNVA